LIFVLIVYAWPWMTASLSPKVSIVGRRYMVLPGRSLTWGGGLPFPKLFYHCFISFPVTLAQFVGYITDAMSPAVIQQVSPN